MASVAVTEFEDLKKGRQGIAVGARGFETMLVEKASRWQRKTWNKKTLVEWRVDALRLLILWKDAIETMF